MSGSSGTPWIAIAGNVTSGASTEEKAKAVETARLLGHALAAAGYGLIVYSSEDRFLEPHLVEGYVKSGAARKESIRMLYPAAKGTVAFPELATNRALFVDEPDTSPNWETSYYESLGMVHGILMMGGGRSTLIAGVVGLGYDRPVVPIATFGGHAFTVWKKLDPVSGPLTREEHALLASRDWTAESARSAIAIFANHAERVRARELNLKIAAAKAARETKTTAFWAVGLFVLTAGIVLTAIAASEIPKWALVTMLAGSALAAGVSGTTLRTLSDLGENQLSGGGQPLYMRTSLGLVAGLLAALLVAVPQVTADPHIPEGVAMTAAQKEVMKTERLRGAIPPATFGALLAGFAADQFFRKVKELKLKEIEFPKA